jgi:hypothetical protein
MSQSDSTPDGPATPQGVALTLSEAAQACGVHRATIRRYLDGGKLAGAFKGADGAWRVPVPDLINAGLRLTQPQRQEPDELDQVRAENTLLRERLAAEEAVRHVLEQNLDDLRLALRMLPAPAETWPKGGRSQEATTQPQESYGEEPKRRWWRRSRE